MGPSPRSDRGVTLGSAAGSLTRRAARDVHRAAPRLWRATFLGGRRSPGTDALARCGQTRVWTMNDAVAQRVTEHRSREPGRGREASKPKEIPAAGWKDILYRVWDEIGNDRVGTIAAGTTFFVLLALFPAIAALVSIYGLVADPATIQDHLNDVAGYVPAEMLSLVSDQLKRLSTTEHEALGFGFVLGLLLALYSANNGVKALFDALNVAYDEEEKRNFIQLNLRSFAFTLGAIVFAILV